MTISHDPKAFIPEARRNIPLDTYRYLRAGMVVLVIVLGVAVVMERSTAHCFENSISAYYFTPVHSIFIAVLCALGALLIIYKGSTDTEDVLLTLAGILAFIVAMVPTNRHLPPLTDPTLVCGRFDLPTDYQVEHGVTNNVSAVIIALLLAQLLVWWQYRRTHTSRSPSLGGVISRVLLWAIMSVGVIALIFCPPAFVSHGHGFAAVTMFLAIIVTVAITAFLTGRQESRHKHIYQRVYQIVAGAMLLTVVGVVISHLLLPSGFRQWILVVETALILEFAAYWVAQTVELWNYHNRIALLPEGDQQRLAEGRAVRRGSSVAPEVHTDSKLTAGEKMLRAL
jgi:hypothetical protein